MLVQDMYALGSNFFGRDIVKKEGFQREESWTGAKAGATVPVQPKADASTGATSAIYPLPRGIQEPSHELQVCPPGSTALTGKKTRNAHEAISKSMH